MKDADEIFKGLFFFIMGAGLTGLAAMEIHLHADRDPPPGYIIEQSLAGEYCFTGPNQRDRCGRSPFYFYTCSLAWEDYRANHWMEVGP